MADMTREQLTDLLRQMVVIRRFEEEVKRLYRAGEITGAIHLCIGQEAVAAGTCFVLREDDYVTSTHRPHGHCLAKVRDIKRTMAEMMGKASGLSGGFGGSMHQFCKARGFLGGNGIVGGGMGIAAGAAFAAQYRGTDQVALCFFSDGAANQGVLAECLNIASLWQLPLVFVCENNRYAATTPVEKSTCTPDIAPRAEPYGIPWRICDGNDVFDVIDSVSEAIGRARTGRGPTFVEAKTYRVEPHCGIIADRRDTPELALWKSSDKDPIARYERILRDERRLSDAQIRTVHDDVEEALMAAVDFARNSPLPSLNLVTDMEAAYDA